ncbi:hypothetical protein ONZ45_g13340 [Pleurotus djamor]|nr:hypothetical protein ONZ45_g13340 [Pleurotus djamor]
MDAYFDNKTNILNAHIRTTYDDSILYKVKSTTSFRGPRITVLEDANPVPGYTGSNIVGAIHWKDKLLEVHGHRRPLADIKRREGRMFHLNSSKHWRWGNEHREYQVRFEDDEWKVTVDHGMSIAARFEVPLRPHLFTKAKPPVIHLTRTALEADEVFMILVLIYSESRRQDRTDHIHQKELAIDHFADKALGLNLFDVLKGTSDDSLEHLTIGIFSWPSKSRQSEAEILKHKRDPKLEDDLPNLLHVAEFGDPSGIQGRLYDHFKTLSEQRPGENPYEEQILRVHVFERLHPMDDFMEKPAEFIGRRYLEFVRCLAWVHDFAGVLHCDVSWNNFMIRKKDGKFYGVLNDFDLAINAQWRPPQANKGPNPQQRTCTRPLMAIELLEKKSPALPYPQTRSRVFIALYHGPPVLPPNFAIMENYLRYTRLFFKTYLDFANDTVAVTHKETDTFDGLITDNGFLRIADTYLPPESDAPDA